MRPAEYTLADDLAPLATACHTLADTLSGALLAPIHTLLGHDPQEDR